MGNENSTQKSFKIQSEQKHDISASIFFQTLKNLLTPLSSAQCITHRLEILICGGSNERECYSYHTVTNEYKLICKYPIAIELDGHCVVKIKDKNDNITLLSFGGKNKHTLIMKYVSVWNDESNTEKLPRNYNKWVSFVDNDNRPITLGRDEDNYCGIRAVIGGSKNHLLFLTRYPNNIDVFDLNTYQFIKYDTLPTDNYSYYHCFVSNLENAQDIITKVGKRKSEMLLFCKKTGLSIEYDEDSNTFQFQKLSVCDEIAPFRNYACICVNDVILFFGGWDSQISNTVVSKSIYKYSIRENKWTTFPGMLPSLLYDSAAILSEDNTYVHIIGGWNGKAFLPIHMKTKVSEWLSEDETKKERVLKKEETEKKKENETSKIIAKNKVNKDDISGLLWKKKIEKRKKKKKWIEWWKERNEIDKSEMIAKFEQLSSKNFEVWLRGSKWKKSLKKEKISSICTVIKSYICYHFISSVILLSLMEAMMRSNKTKKDKTEITKELQAMSNEQFEVLLKEYKWKDEVTKEDIDTVRSLIHAHLTS
ncbi:hypothetical protein RFI_13077, partial [Reticulomyxa filosa]